MAFNVRDELAVTANGLFYLVNQQQLYLANWYDIEVKGKTLSPRFDEKDLLGLGKSTAQSRGKLKLSDIDLERLDLTLEVTLAIIGDSRSEERMNTTQMMSYLHGVPDDISERLGDYKPRFLYDMNRTDGDTHAFFRKSYFKLR
jgi:hypothetical protein